MNLTPSQLNEVIEAYCDDQVESMSLEELKQVLYEQLCGSFSKYTEREMQEVIVAVKGDEFYNSLLRKVTES